jgi:DNA-binding NtrC family response regulator
MRKDPSREMASILLVDDDPLILRSLAVVLEREGYAVTRAPGGAAAVAELKDNVFDAVVTDFNMPEVDGMQILREVKARKPDCAVIMITGYGTVEQAVEAIKLGAYDYICKPIIDDEMKVVIARAVEQKRLRSENADLRQRLDLRYSYTSIIGRDYKMQKIYDTISLVAPTKANVLITGESGTGKTMIARAIHHNSSRKDGPFVEVNCGALPETLLESELFGHTRGSFTGAIADNPGKFRIAHTGSIFLDEISNSSPILQMKLLRILQDKEFEPVGGRDTVKVDVRVILATNTDLALEVKEGRFREDLYYRINVVTIHLPPLRDRIGDIPLLAEHFLRKYAKENEKRIDSIADETFELLSRYGWPGNVRELENVIERAVVLTRNDHLTPQDLPPTLIGDGAGLPETVTVSDEIQPLKRALEDPERRIIERVLQKLNGSRQKTAEALDINRTTLFNKMKKYELLEKY